MTTNQTIDGVPLLPCPFCGDTPDITKHHREEIYGLIHRCPVAGAISWGFIEEPALHVKRWNRRHIQEQTAPVAVVLPERLPGDDGVCTEAHYASGWNACIDDVTRLNAKTR